MLTSCICNLRHQSHEDAVEERKNYKSFFRLRTEWSPLISELRQSQYGLTTGQRLSGGEQTVRFWKRPMS